ncbi:MAG TPA: hypothetical protein VF918_22385 [Anaerolineales bacterium]
MWTTIQIILGLLGILLILGGEKLSIPFFSYAGLACLGLTSMAIGWEAIITRHIVFGRRRHGDVQTYTNLPAILQGIQFNLLGLFLIVVSIMMDENINGRELVLQMARHPGLPLILFGALCLMQAVITLVGSHELQEGQRWIVIMNLLVSRLLPGIILVLIGLGMTGLGLFEILAPKLFDEMGGGFLEVLYGLR